MSLTDQVSAGPLAGLRVIEMDAIGPVPMLGTMLADFGADVVRIARAGGAWGEMAQGGPALHRSRRRLELDLKSPAGQAQLLQLIAGADALIEGFRPGVMERLGLGPAVCHAANPALVYGRMTGWGQSGPRAAQAGHDINYLALTGVLDMIGPADRPVAPLNLAADYAGGAMMLAFGLLAALLHARRTGQGQVVDAAMTDGVVALSNLFRFYAQTAQWQPGREANLLDGGAPFYACYPCADGRFVAVGCIEPQFFAQLMTGLGLDHDPATQHDPAGWPALRARIAAAFLTRPRDDWARQFAQGDACVTPVLTLEESRHDPHNLARSAHVEHEGYWQAAPAPHLSQTPGRVTPRAEVGFADLLAEWSRGQERLRPSAGHH